MPKILSLDIGDVWIGSALSDSSRKYSFPLKTIKVSDFSAFINEITKAENIEEIVYGVPYTMKGEIGEQGKKTLEFIEKFKTKFNKDEIRWTGWDERLSSHTAKKVINMQNKKIKDLKIQEHSIAAATILECYLNYLNR